MLRAYISHTWLLCHGSEVQRSYYNIILKTSCLKKNETYFCLHLFIYLLNQISCEYDCYFISFELTICNLLIKRLIRNVLISFSFLTFCFIFFLDNVFTFISEVYMFA